ncbi:GntR family transcriptional regulator [Labrys miyagiensis]
MRLVSPWKPRLSEGEGSPHERLVAAIADDIAEGELVPGARLPPHRELAYRLGIGLGTVTKAYAVLERRGLVRSERGRGMFVSGLAARRTGVIDLSVNIPPQMLSERLLAATLTAMARRLDADLFGSYLPPAGRDDHRALLAGWLAGQKLDARPEHLLICNGAQHALAIAFAAVAPAGGVILTEAITYPGAIMLARQHGHRLIGIDTDARGLRPDALEKALHSLARVSRPKLLYVTPTLHNPTAATMDARRREDIAHLCRRHDVVIVEDDIHAIFAGPGHMPIATLAPERTLHVSGLSKVLSPGLRIGSLVVPPAFLERAMSALRTTCTMAAPLACLIMEQWLTDGTAQSVAASIRTDAARRLDLARTLLRLEALPGPSGFHLWLPMPSSRADRLAAATAAQGVLVMQPRAPLVDVNAAQGGIRLSLGGPSPGPLKEALVIIAGLLGEEGSRGYGNLAVL